MCVFVRDYYIHILHCFLFSSNYYHCTCANVSACLCNDVARNAKLCKRKYTLHVMPHFATTFSLILLCFDAIENDWEKKSKFSYLSVPFIRDTGNLNFLPAHDYGFCCVRTRLTSIMHVLESGKRDYGGPKKGCDELNKIDKLKKNEFRSFCLFFSFALIKFHFCISGLVIEFGFYFLCSFLCTSDVLIWSIQAHLYISRANIHTHPNSGIHLYDFVRCRSSASASG